MNVDTHLAFKTLKTMEMGDQRHRANKQYSLPYVKQSALVDPPGQSMVLGKSISSTSSSAFAACTAAARTGTVSRRFR